MEFEGQIIKVCEPRTGTSARTGNEWKTQGFVFEYKEHDTDPWHDKVYLETFDENIMKDLAVGACAKVVSVIRRGNMRAACSTMFR